MGWFVEQAVGLQTHAMHFPQMRPVQAVTSHFGLTMNKKLSLKFLEIEENILKLMDKKQNIDKEFEKLQKNNKKEGEV